VRAAPTRRITAVRDQQLGIDRGEGCYEVEARAAAARSAHKCEADALR